MPVDYRAGVGIALAQAVVALLRRSDLVSVHYNQPPSGEIQNNFVG
jgi:hypothetical protein